MHQETCQQGGRAEPKRKPAGGFILISVTQLIMAWTALKDGHIGLRELRVWFALFEMKARRCGAKDDQTPEFGIDELRGLVGGEGGEALRECLRRLKAAGLIRTLTKESIELASTLDELNFDANPVREALDKIPNHDRLVPVPRRVVRLIAGGARRTLIATLIGHMVRCLYYRKGMVHPAGAVKASWVADVFGVSERRVHEQRQHLIELRILLPLDTPQQVLNRYGQWVVWNLDWSPIAQATLPTEVKPKEGRAGEPIPSEPSPPPVEPSPPPAEIPPPIVTPIEKTPKPLRELETRKPASGGPAGFSKTDREEKTPEPTLRNVQPEDLRDPVRLMTLHGQATTEGAISNSEADRLNFFAAANHARVIGSINPPGLFVRIIRSKLFGFLTQADEDAARAQIRRMLYSEASSKQSPHSGHPRAFSGPSLSDDARFVRDITRVLKGKGIPESSAWRFVNREKPEWTRERWDQAQAELDGRALVR